MLKIYLAGPEVFLPDAAAHGRRLKQLCADCGLEGLYPLDNLVGGDNLLDVAEQIRAANVRMIQACDIVLANLSPFRGPEPDSGTVWEIGYAECLGKPVFAYSTDMRTQKEKVIALMGLPVDAKVDREGMEIEEFGMTHNLMFARHVAASSFESCLTLVREHTGGAQS